MHGLTTEQRAPRESRSAWNDDNARGLAFAASGAWDDAAEAFATAARAVDSPTDVASHEALALVLNNLAQAFFRAGRIDEGIQHAQRACSLRAALLGDDATSVARARADLAVMLGTAGRADEGLALIKRAIHAIERNGGDEDLRLSSVLENAARLALTAGQPSTAEPYLLRLHALLDSHELPTEPADRLLARVAKYRARYRHAMLTMYGVAADPQPAPEVVPTPVVASTAVPIADPALDTMRIVTERTPVDVVAIAEDAEDDEPLRDAVRITDALLRTTPSSVRAIVPTLDLVASDSPTVAALATWPTPEMGDLPARTTGATPALSTMAIGVELDLVDDVRVGAAQSTTASDAAHADDILGGAMFDLVDESTPTSAAPASPGDARAHALGFAVEYGTPSESTVPDLADMLIPPPTSSRVRTPEDGVETSPVVAGVMSHGMLARSRPAVVMPSPAASQRAISASPDSAPSDGEADDNTSAPRLTLHLSEDLARDRRKRPNIRAGRASAPRSSRGMIIAGAATSTVAAMICWLVFFRGA